jgi:hypothetical protein
MKSKRRILVGDCSELYRKKKDRKDTLEFHVDEGLKDRLATMFVARWRWDQEITGNNYTVGVDRAAPQDGFPRGYSGNIMQLPDYARGVFRTGDVVFFDQLTRRYTTTQPTEGNVQPIGIALDSIRIALSGSDRLPTHNHGVDPPPPRHAYARHTIQPPEEDNRPVRYVVHPGTITSNTDYQDHFVHYAALIRLYNVNTIYCKSTSEWNMGSHEPAWPEEYRIVHLYPQASGDYTLPERDRIT